MPDVLMPRLSDTMTEGVISQWLMHEGDEVKRGDTLAEIETDKATMELEAFDAGTLTKILVPAGQTVPIGERVAIIGEAGQPGPDPSAPSGTAEAPAPASESVATKHVGTAEGEAGPQDAGGAAPAAGELSAGHSAESTDGTGAPEIRATPLVRSLARERGIDLATVQGSGPGGRIVRADLETVLADGAPAGTSQPGGPSRPAPAGAETAPTPAPTPAPATGTTASTTGPADEAIPLSQVRRVTAKRLTESAAAPHFHVTMVADVTALLDFRAQVNTQLANDGVRISVTDLLVRACAVALRLHPDVNASWSGDHIIRRGHVNVGVAVALDEGLIVPVIRDADRKTLREISVEASDLGDRARGGKLGLEEFTGGTFTISNLGMYGVTEFNAVINPPEAAILAVGAAAPTPVVTDGAVTTTTTLRLNLTVDHRVLDGATAAAFLRDIVRLLEEPLRIVT